MRALVLGFVTSTAVLVWACGGAAPGEAGTGAGGSGGTCTADDNPAGSCAPPVECVLAEGPQGTCTCDADAGLFSCELGQLLPHSFPATQPKTGDCCTVEDMICGGWDICAPICTCHGGKWTCKDPDCPLFFCPSPIGKLQDQFCDDRIQDTCTESVMGCFQVCTCELDFDLGRGVWQCGMPICNFDGGVPPP